MQFFVATLLYVITWYILPFLEAMGAESEANVFPVLRASSLVGVFTLKRFHIRGVCQRTCLAVSVEGVREMLLASSDYQLRA